MIFNIHQDRVDELLFEKMVTPRFSDLWVIVEKLLLFLHGQASVKRGFSINKNLEETNLKAESLHNDIFVILFIQLVGYSM